MIFYDHRVFRSPL